jgi:hypothetical protein
MGMTVDAALVSLGEPEPPLQVQVVVGEVAAVLMATPIRRFLPLSS